ncbi:MAG: hypothetical protein AB1467_02970 [Candidatus Diapherotrites archaeon]
MTGEKTREKTENKSQFSILLAGIIAVMLVVIVFQAFQINSMTSAITGLKTTQATTGLVTAASSTSNAANSTANTTSNSTALLSDVIPKGVPAIYGKELGVSFDDVSASNAAKADETIGKLGALDNQIQLSGDLLQRYIKITGQISCEYCCGAQSIIFTTDSGKYKAGDAACGCAHSFAMRGVAKYLLKNHASQYTDDQILEELGKWKTLFFPGQITQKAKILQEKGIQLNYINLASNKYRGIEKGSSGSSMVGGC